jgi:hypothetical protein
MNSLEASGFLLVPWYPVTITLGPQNKKNKGASSAQGHQQEVRGWAESEQRSVSEESASLELMEQCQHLSCMHWASRKPSDPQIPLSLSPGVLKGHTVPKRIVSCHIYVNWYMLLLLKSQRKELDYFYLMAHSSELIIKASNKQAIRNLTNCS